MTKEKAFAGCRNLLRTVVQYKRKRSPRGKALQGAKVMRLADISRGNT